MSAASRFGVPALPAATHSDRLPVATAGTRSRGLDYAPVGLCLLSCPGRVLGSGGPLLTLAAKRIGQLTWMFGALPTAGQQPAGSTRDLSGR